MHFISEKNAIEFYTQPFNYLRPMLQDGSKQKSVAFHGLRFGNIMVSQLRN